MPAIQKIISKLRFAIERIVTKRTKTEISLEIQEEVALRAHRIAVAACPVCRCEVGMVPANEAAMVAKVKARQIYEFVNSGELHFTEDRFGLLYICSESLRNLGTAETGGVARAANDSDETIFESDESDSHGDEIPRRHPNSQ